ncbi:MAG: preprotein translocase subunit SecG [Clostridia bacterium]|nr:preprotein translocase subunit SecG [Clostridia bacterium]
MEIFTNIMSGLLIAMALFLVVAVLMQQGKDKGMGGAIAGGADNFFGKNKSQQRDRKFNRLTTIVAIAFAVVLLVVYVIQPDIVYTQTDYERVPGAFSPYYDSEVIAAEDDKEEDKKDDSTDGGEVTE